MVSTYHFALGKRKAFTNVLDSIWGTVGFFEKIRIKFAIWGQWKTKNELIQSFLPRALDALGAFTGQLQREDSTVPDVSQLKKV